MNNEYSIGEEINKVRLDSFDFFFIRLVAIV